MKLRVVRAHDKLVAAVDSVDLSVHHDFHSSFATFAFEHRENVPRGAVAEKLAKLLLVIRDSMLLNQLNKIGRSIASERRFGEVRIGREKVIRPAMKVGEVAAPPA